MVRLGGVRIVFALALCGCVYPALCQTPDAGPHTFVPVTPDTSASPYEWFFSQVFQLKAAADRGQTLSVYWTDERQPLPRLQDLIGLTDSEVALVNAVATECLAEIDELQHTGRALIFESRLEFIETGEHSEALAVRIKRLEDRHPELVTNYVNRLKAALPEAQFRKLDTFVRTTSAAKLSLLSTVAPKPAKKQ
jgi:hypothetical protein